MELILHIGSSKTGTTSLQWAFRSNRDLLSKEGIYYPLSKECSRYGSELYNNIVAEIMDQILGVDEKSQVKLNMNVEKSINAVLCKSKKVLQAKFCCLMKFVFSIYLILFREMSTYQDKLQKHKLKRLKTKRIKWLFQG